MRMAWTGLLAAALLAGCAGKQIADEPGFVEVMGEGTAVTYADPPPARWGVADVPASAPPETRRQEPSSIDEPGPLDEPGSEPGSMQKGDDVKVESLGPASEVARGPSPPGAEDLLPTVTGEVVDASEARIVVRDGEGKRHRLNVDDQSNAWVNDTEVGPGVLTLAVEEGDQVRASFHVFGDLPFLRRLEVLGKGAEAQAPGEPQP